MTITELISKLEKMREEYGDVLVEVRNSFGDWGYVEHVSETHYCFISSEPKWVVFIES